MTACQCMQPGWCERHQCYKTEHWWELCRTRADYFGLWEEGRGPGQTSAEGARGAPAACRHRGAMTRDVQCPSCRAHVLIKVYACQRHKECTLGRALDGILCCATCWDYQPVAASVYREAPKV